MMICWMRSLYSKVVVRSKDDLSKLNDTENVSKSEEDVAVIEILTT